MKSVIKQALGYKSKAEVKFEQEKVVAKGQLQILLQDEFDSIFYRDYYSDLEGLNDMQLSKHWLDFGKKEGRISSLKMALQLFGVTKDDYQSNLIDPNFYLRLYHDLVENGIDTQLKAELHYFTIGKHEGRHPSLKAFFKVLGLEPSKILLDSIENSGMNGTNLQQLLSICSGESILPLPVGSAKQSAYFYLELAKLYLQDKDKDKDKDKEIAKSFLKVSLNFQTSANAFELLGNQYFDLGLYPAALESYQQAINIDATNYWALVNAVNAFSEQKRFPEALEFLSKYAPYQLENTKLIELADNVAQNYFDWTHANASSNCDLEFRQQLFETFKEYAQKIYKTYKTLFASNSDSLRSLRTNRILIVGDYHVPQCVRYRIDQKVEQLELQGKTVNTVDWLDLDKTINELAFYDVVIFYRVPSVPKVLKAMAQVNTAGKLSVYEIDDLLFDLSYPPPLDTYGGFVNLHLYHELMKGAGLFYSAAQFCRIGLASTVPLVKELEKLVFDKTCFLHRNGLDSLNEFDLEDKTHKKNIDIFYGSGTMAHNTDFTEQVLPALQKVLSEHKEARLIIMGYLKLPEDFTQQFNTQIKQIPPVKNVKNYWSLLKQADINIAVLHEDKITNSKSELKWFEAACYGIPSVLSTTENYRDVIHHNKDAILVANVDEWYDTLTLLVNDSKKRQEIGLIAQERVKQEYSLQSIGKQFISQLDQYLAQHKPDKKRKKIFLVNVFFAPQSIGGATRVVEDNLDVLLEQYSADYDVTIFTADVHHRKSHQITMSQYKGCNVYRATTLWREHMDWHAKDPEMYNLFKELLTNEQPDFVHFHCVQRLTASIVEATFDAKIPYFVTVHDAWWISDYQFLVDEEDTVYPQGHPDPYETVPVPTNITVDESIERRSYLKDLLNSASKVFVVSESFADIYRKNGIQNLVVTKNGLSEKIAWAPKETAYSEKVVCALIGGMSAHKGYEILKIAIGKAKPQNCEFLFVDHSKESGYESITSWSDVPITFLGREKQADMVNLYQKIDVLFAPSIWPESFGLVTREAAACGCWVVASNLGGIGEDVIEGQNGHVIDPTELALVEVLSAIDKNAQKYKQLAECKVCNTVTNQVNEIVEFYK